MSMFSVSLAIKENKKDGETVSGIGSFKLEWKQFSPTCPANTDQDNKACYSLDYACLLKPKISILHQKPVSPFFEFSLLWLLPLSPNVDTMFTITRDKGTTV